MPLLPQNLNLSLRQAGETKHANLAGNMIPRARGSLLLQSLPQSPSHLLDPTTHSPQILLPLLKELRVIQNPTRNSGTIGRRVGDLRALQNGQLTRDVGIGLFTVRTRRRDKVERASSLTVQTEVLSEGLGDAQFETLVYEVADSPSVADQIARGETLVRGVEEGEVVLFFHDGCDLFPLVLGRVDAGGVVGAGVEEDDRAGRRCLQRLEHTGEIEAFGLFGEVGVGGQLEADVCEDLVVVGPCWVREVDGGFGGLRVEFREEEAA